MLRTDVDTICRSIKDTESCLYSYRTILIEIYHYQLSFRKTPIDIFASFFVTRHDGMWYYNTLKRAGFLPEGMIAWPPLKGIPAAASNPKSMFKFVIMRNDIIIPVTSVFMDQRKLRECFDVYSEHL